MTKEIMIIQLTQNQQTIINSEDYEKIKPFKWHYNGGYARTTLKRGSLPHRSLPMHRLLMGSPEGMSIDHINGDRLDNRKENLRICKNAENIRNQRARSGCGSKYKGIYWHKRDKKWVVRIGKGGKVFKVGRFDCEIRAALAYNEAAERMFGEFARPNIIDHSEVEKEEIHAGRDTGRDEGRLWC